MAEPFARDSHLRLDIPDGKGDDPDPFAAPDRTGKGSVSRDALAGIEVPRRTPLPPGAENWGDSSIVVRRDDVVVEERMREQLEQLIQSDMGLKASPAQPQRLRQPDQSGRYKAFIAMAAAVIAVFGFTAIMPSMFARPGVDPVRTSALPALIPPTQIEPFADLKPAPVPAQRAAPAPPAPVLKDSTTAAESAPVLDKPGSVPSELHGTALTEAEQAAVDRGLKELERTAAINAQPRVAPNGFALTEAEKASVERGLRELEKAAKRGKQQPRRR